MYIRMKQRAAEEAGITFTHVHLPETAGEAEILGAVRKLNEDTDVHGILVQLPLPAGINDKKVTEAVLPEKDVDGYVRSRDVFPCLGCLLVRCERVCPFARCVSVSWVFAGIRDVDGYVRQDASPCPGVC